MLSHTTDYGASRALHSDRFDDSGSSRSKQLRPRTRNTFGRGSRGQPPHGDYPLREKEGGHYACSAKALLCACWKARGIRAGDAGENGVILMEFNFYE